MKSKIKFMHSFLALLVAHVLSLWLASQAWSGAPVYAEYYFDVDPGQGNGMPMIPSDGFFDEEMEFLKSNKILSSDLAVGEHTLYVRTRDVEHNWSMARQLKFQITDANPYKTITAAEYYIDTDPGEGNGISLIPTDGDFDEPVEDAIYSDLDSDTAANGVHWVYVRFRDNHLYYPTFSGWGPVDSVKIDIPLDVEDIESSSIPCEYLLLQNYPNPFNPTTSISFALPRTRNVSLSVYNILGQMVAILVDGELSAGEYTIVWDGNGSNGQAAATGIYLYRLQTNEFTETRRMLLLK